MHRIEPHPSRTVAVLGRQMAYVEMGRGAPILFLHGNPTSSYLWRNVMPELAPLGRCVAPDLIGMGRSEKLEDPGPDSYRYERHAEFLDAFIEALGLGQTVTLILHDWGSMLGFDWARRHPGRVKAVAYMEAIVRPFETWDDFNPDAASIFQGFRSSKGEEMVLKRNLFIERVLPGSILRTLTDLEMDIYRRPYASAPSDRWPTLSWPRHLPIAGSPPHMVELSRACGAFMAETPIPKLFVNAEPGAILTGAQRAFCRSWPNQTEITVAGAHFIQEDSGPEIGAAIAEWLSDM